MPDEEAIEVESEVLRDETPVEETEEPSQEAVESEEAEAEDSTEAKEATEEPGDDDTAEPKKKDRVQKRIDRLTADKRAAERRVQELEGKLVESIKPPEPTSPLKEADFENYEDFLVAKATQQAEANVTARIAEEQKRRQADQQRTRQADMADNFQARAEDARERHDDFDDVAFDPTTPVTEHMMATILESENGPEIAYHLGSNHQEARRISSLSPLGQARELGKIEATLTLEAPTKLTTAPDPPNKLKGKARATRDLGKMSQAEYEAHRSKSKRPTL